MTPSLFAFVDSQEFDDGRSIRGAALVTDGETEPVEFRCTSAIRPTLLQRTLWGKRLAGHIAARLIGKPLLDALTNSIVLVVVRKPEFVELRELVQRPLLQVLRHEELRLASTLASTKGDDEMLQGDGGQFEPLVLKSHRKYEEDRKSARDLLAGILRSHSLLEPFERIKNALDLVHEQDANPGK